MMKARTMMMRAITTRKKMHEESDFDDDVDDDVDDQQ